MKRPVSILLAGLSALAACGIPAPTRAQVPSCFPDAVPIAGWGPDLQRSVVVRDPAVFAGADFSLGRTLDSIVASMKIRASQGERIALLQSMIRSFDRTSFVNPDGDLKTPTSPRPQEAALDPLAMLNPTHKDGFRPVAVFNRLDLAPDDWSNCGEHRIVYAKGDGADPLDRMTLIFEARVGNPTGRKEACRPIAAFWDGLADPTNDPAALAGKLARFFFAGSVDADDQSDLPGGGPVIHADHLGLVLGQVRGNLFMTGNVSDGRLWQLREWRIVAGADAAPAFSATTVKQNPLPALYGAQQPGDPADLAARRDDFLGALIGKTAANLTLKDSTRRADNAAWSKDEVLAGLAAGFEVRFDAFTSHSAPAKDDDPVALANENARIKASLQARLAGLTFPAGCAPTVDHLLNRAGAVTCGGCHQFSVGKLVAPGNVTWPAAVPPGFVHVDEAGRLSDALERHFLPERRRVLARYLSETASTPAPVVAAAAPSPAAELIRRLPAAASAADRLDLLRDAEVHAAAERRREASRPGAFTPVRRPH